MRKATLELRSVRSKSLCKNLYTHRAIYRYAAQGIHSHPKIRMGLRGQGEEGTRKDGAVGSLLLGSCSTVFSTGSFSDFSPTKVRDGRTSPISVGQPPPCYLIQSPDGLVQLTFGGEVRGQRSAASLLRDDPLGQHLAF